MVRRACLECGQTWVRAKDYTIGICCFSTKHARRNSKDGFARNQNNVFEWSDMSTRGLEKEQRLVGWESE